MMEKEPVHYAFVKGYELMTGKGNWVPEGHWVPKYWIVDTADGNIFITERSTVRDKYLIKAKKSEWSKFGINEDNADFVKVEEGYNMERILATIESSYGKGSGEEVNERFIIKDTREERERLLDEWVWDKGDIQDNMEDFLSGKINSVYADLIGGDWDEPTGRYIFLQTKEEALEYEKDKYEGAVKSIEQFFDGSLERSIRFD